MRTVPAEHITLMLSVNVDNEKLSDADFREFVRNTLPIVKQMENPNETTKTNI